MYMQTAKGCAWRAIYISSGKPGEYGAQRFSIGIDPTWRFNRAKLFVSFGYRRDCTGGRKGTWCWSIMLPRSRHWWKLDGRKV